MSIHDKLFDKQAFPKMTVAMEHECKSPVSVWFKITPRIDVY